MAFLKFKKEVTEHLVEVLAGLSVSVSVEDLSKEIKDPPSPDLGQFAYPCFRWSKALRRSPADIAVELEKLWKNSNYTATATGPYLNLAIKEELLLSETLSEVFSKKAEYGRSEKSNSQTVLIEYCSPNVAKKLGFQHLRSTLLGNILANIYEAAGFKVVRMNFVGDWGTQFAKLVSAVQEWAPSFNFEKEPIEAAMNKLFEVYVKFHQEEQNNPALTEKAKAVLSQLEAKNASLLSLWKNIREVSVKTMLKTLAPFQVHFDVIEGESEYLSDTEKLMAFVKEKAGAHISEGALICEIPGVSVPALLQKKDGTTLYLTRDLQAAMARGQKYNFYKSIYVVSEQQKLHFQQLFGLIKKLGFSYHDSLEHVSFGTVLFGSQKMSTREGKVVFLEEIMQEAFKKALEACEAKNPSLANKEEVASFIGLSALVFGNLSSHRKSDIEFTWEKTLNFEGETGPYVLYSVVRCYSLLKKANITPGSLSYQPSGKGSSLTLEENALVALISRFHSVLLQVLENHEPYLLIFYLIEVSKAFNRFYYQCPVLNAQPEEKTRRLLFVEATRMVLENGLSLLGLKAPKEM